VSYIGPPPVPNSNNQTVQFSYTNCSGVPSGGTVGYEVANPSVNVCAQVGTIRITGGDTGCNGNAGSPCASWAVSTDVNCCLQLGRCWTMTWETDNPQTPPPPSTLYVRYTNSSGVVVSQSILSLPSIDNVGDNSATAFVCSYYPVAPLCVDYNVVPPRIVDCFPYIWITEFNTCTTNLGCNSVTPPTSLTPTPTQTQTPTITPTKTLTPTPTPTKIPTLYPSRISAIPNSFDGCAATLDTDCWVTNVNTSTPGVEIATSSSVVYANATGTIPFVGITGEYKIKITGSSVCTSNAVASNGSVTPLEGICFSCS
jgi:hypothetical protein